MTAVSVWAALKLGGQVLPEGALGALALPEQTGWAEAAAVTGGLLLAWLSTALRGTPRSAPDSVFGRRPTPRAAVKRARAARASAEGPYTEFPATMLLDRWGER